ncbi:DUF5946 family protein [Pseudonocardia ailaonensis]|uniref:DUF5946 family protein n=1 Tax=Pseudonocardia ailaonensis TaxID=367279 RepID=UPI0031D8B9DF
MTSEQDLFERLLALDHSRAEPWGPLHGVVVAAFTLQHDHEPRPADDPALELLRAFVERGREGLAAVTARRRRANSHRGAGLARPTGPLLPAPAGFAVRIGDVTVDGGFPADGHAERVRAWALATLTAWADQPT